jgi:D-glycero-D-manno-heptose 1,7-bisphosphate phosphatase
MLKRAVFLDKDGTLVENVPYNVDPMRIRLTADCASGLRSLHEAGYALIVISNQSGVARGYFDEDALVPVEHRLLELLAEIGVPLAGFYFCPHHPDGTVDAYRRQCFCRKPQPGLLLHAAEVHDLDLARSWLVGDILDDMEAGCRAGCRTVLIDNGNETEWIRNYLRQPHYSANSIDEAAELILTDPSAAPCAVPSLTGGHGR